jgi:hypothetical protein
LSATHLVGTTSRCASCQYHLAVAGGGCLVRDPSCRHHITLRLLSVPPRGSGWVPERDEAACASLVKSNQLHLCRLQAPILGWSPWAHAQGFMLNVRFADSARLRRAKTSQGLLPPNSKLFFFGQLAKNICESQDLIDISAGLRHQFGVVDSRLLEKRVLDKTHHSFIQS